MEDRYLYQNKLKNALFCVNNTFHEVITAEFTIVGGDGFQGMISRPESLLNIYYMLFEKIDHPFYLGVGIGDISTDLSDYIQEIDGEAFHFSSESLNSAKKKKRRILFMSVLDNNSLIECILNFIAEIMWGWTPRQRDIILFYRKNDGNDSIKKTASNFNTGTRNIYKMLDVGKYSLIKYAEEVLEEEFKSPFEPKKDQITI